MRSPKRSCDPHWADGSMGSGAPMRSCDSTGMGSGWPVAALPVVVSCMRVCARSRPEGLRLHSLVSPKNRKKSRSCPNFAQARATRVGRTRPENGREKPGFGRALPQHGRGHPEIAQAQSQNSRNNDPGEDKGSRGGLWCHLQMLLRACARARGRGGLGLHLLLGVARRRPHGLRPPWQRRRLAAPEVAGAGALFSPLCVEARDMSSASAPTPDRPRIDPRFDPRLDPRSTLDRP